MINGLLLAPETDRLDSGHYQVRGHLPLRDH